MYLYKYENKDTVRICKKDFCIEAKGKNGSLLVAGCFFLLICAGIAVLANANK